MGMTLAEKILARASGRDRVQAGEFVVGEIDLALTHDIFAAGIFRQLVSLGLEQIPAPDRLVVVFDHFVPAPSEAAAAQHRAIREYVEQFGVRNFYDAGAGICHQILPEKGHVRPGALIVGTDSHTTAHGALAAAATGIGSSEMVYVLATGKLWFRVPATIRFELSGRLEPQVAWKDVILAIAGRFGADAAQYRAVEYGGPAAAAASVASRLTVSNMTVEIGGKFGFFAADDVTLAYLAERGVDAEPLGPDEDAAYEAVHELDLSTLEPQVACPHEVDHVVPVGEVAGTRIHQAFLGSCTNGRLEDLEAAAAVLRGRQVHPRVRLLVAPASRAVFQEATRSGATQVLADAGASILPPGCGPCFGGHGGLLAPGEACIGTHNRNFIGRMGSTQAGIYLASPATVAASAIAGCIADPREAPVAQEVAA